MRVAVDVGFGYTKALSESNLNCIFPSIIFKGNNPELSIGKAIGGGSEKYEVAIDTGEGDTKYYFVGDNALINGGIRKWADKKEFNEEELKTLIFTALSLVYPTGGEVDLTVGLPMSYYKEKKERIVEILNNLDLNVYVHGVGKSSMKIKSVFCFPQGGGSYWSEIIDTKGNIKNIDLAKLPVGVIDIGYRTVDYLVMERGRERVSLVDSLTGSLEEDGMYKVFSNTEKKVSEVLGKEFGMDNVEKGLLWYEDKKIYFDGQNIDLTPYFEEALKESAEQIATKLKQIWGNRINNLAYIFLSGGGGADMYSYLKDKFSQLKLQNDSNFSNCKGFLGIQATKLLKN